MGEPFELTFVNGSRRPRTACVYLSVEDSHVPDVRSLAWLVAGAAPTTEVAFTWRLDFAFTWAETGPLSPGTVFMPVQVWAAGSGFGNEVTLSCQRGRHFFTRRGHDPAREGLFVRQDAAVLPAEASVGIAIDGTPAFAVQAHPRSVFALPPPSLACHVAIGDIVQGEVLDPAAIRRSAAVPMAKTMRVTLGSDLALRVT
jgi:hypothetical protein